MTLVDKFPLADAIEQIRSELLVALKKGAGQELQFRLRPIELELNIAATEDVSVGGGLKFWVMNFDSEVAEKTTAVHKIKVVLDPVGLDGRSEFLISERGTPEPQ